VADNEIAWSEATVRGMKTSELLVFVAHPKTLVADVEAMMDKIKSDAGSEIAALYAKPEYRVPNPPPPKDAIDAIKDKASAEHERLMKQIETDVGAILALVAAEIDRRIPIPA
jgi:hypothetical protein